MSRAARLWRARRRAVVCAGAIALGLLSSAATVWAEALPAEEVFATATAALERGEYNAAIEGFESLADRGFASPDASYNRGLAYVMRVREKADKPGDLGRAAAAFAEALRLRPDDGDADSALDRVRAEVTRRRARKGKDAVVARPTLDRVLVGLASERGWAMAAMAASLMLALGLVLRRRPAGPAHVAGSVIVPSALVALLAFVPLTWAARSFRLHTQAGVIVAPEAYLTDELGQALKGEPLPEAASVEVRDRADARYLVRWGATEGWIPAGSVRVLQP